MAATDRPARRLPALPLPASGWPLCLLIALFLIAGNLGHDPWKIEDAAHFGVVWRAVGAGEWLTLSFATATDGVVEPPLYYWTARLLGSLFAPVIGWPDAVRLASPLFAAIAVGALYLAGRELNGPDSAGGAPLALIGSLGFLVQSHETQPMIALLAGIALVCAGLALASRRTLPALALLATGFATITLAHGITMLPAMLLGSALASSLGTERRRKWQTLVAGLAVGSIVPLLWMWQLELAAPSAFGAWWVNELAQFGSVREPLPNAMHLAEVLAWFAWPALPLALWSLWTCRQRLAEEKLALPLAMSLLLFANVAFVFPARPVTALATLPALALLAVPGMMALRRGAANAFDWFGRMTFSLVAALIWLGWWAMNFGVPPKIARNFAKLAPGFTAELEPLSVLVAVVATIAWLWLILVRDTTRPPPALRPVSHWVVGMTLIWLLTATLWLDWINHGKTYRSVATAVVAATKPGRGCIATRSVGEAQFASLDYFLDHRLHARTASRQSCSWLLVQGTPGEPAVEPGWAPVWEGARPGDKSERFRLYRRSAAPLKP